VLSTDVRTVPTLHVSKRHFIFRRAKNIIISKWKLRLLLAAITTHEIVERYNSSAFTELTDQKKMPFFMRTNTADDKKGMAFS
jgi:hypothetical protein